ncbi:hypothetical protein Syun_013180 [Stephania yunnanensis]|uniref:RING-type E3 ubiquitin transferase n=1 Tax=Stephania yunnanensis TaxID=152371 RepID=A0AAP0K1U3_9MAGN
MKMGEGGGASDLDGMKRKLDEAVEESRVCQEENSVLKSRIADYEMTVKELEEKIVSAVELLISVRKQRDEMVVQRDNAVRQMNVIKERMEEEEKSGSREKFFSEFSYEEIEGATRNFDLSLIVAEGGRGIVYKGIVRNTEVVIKMLQSNKFEGESVEFQQEVDILSRVRHPNLVSLIGVCREAGCLVYEYLPNGSLEDRLSCKDNTPPLSWQTRIRFAVEICSALFFLHSHKPLSIVHGDLKPANIFFDANFVSKVGVFDIFGLTSFNENSANEDKSCSRSSSMGNVEYLAPEFFTTGKLTPKSDVYSFGNILLRLLTGRSDDGMLKEVQDTVERGNLSDILDPSAGDWPFVQAQQLAHLALRCCETNRKSRPDLRLDVWKVLEPMKASYGTTVSLGQVQRRIPSYFACPIFQEIMRDPCVAADGFTYEAEAIKAWLDSGHNTSPMTNLKLDHHDLIPNYSLKSAIQEWQH